jgi:hypothetical protein
VVIWRPKSSIRPSHNDEVEKVLLLVA